MQLGEQLRAIVTVIYGRGFAELVARSFKPVPDGPDVIVDPASQLLGGQVSLHRASVGCLQQMSEIFDICWRS